MTLATVLGVLLHDRARRTATRVARAALVVVACAVTALVAVGVIGLRWHYFTDTVGAGKACRQPSRVMMVAATGRAMGRRAARSGARRTARRGRGRG